MHRGFGRWRMHRLEAGELRPTTIGALMLQNLASGLCEAARIRFAPEQTEQRPIFIGCILRILFGQPCAGFLCARFELGAASLDWIQAETADGKGGRLDVAIFDGRAGGPDRPASIGVLLVREIVDDGISQRIGLVLLRGQGHQRVGSGDLQVRNIVAVFDSIHARD